MVRDPLQFHNLQPNTKARRAIRFSSATAAAAAALQCDHGARARARAQGCRFVSPLQCGARHCFESRFSLDVVLPVYKKQTTATTKCGWNVQTGQEFILDESFDNFAAPKHLRIHREKKQNKKTLSFLYERKPYK